MTKLKIYAIIAIIVSGILGGYWMHYKHLKKEISELKLKTETQSQLIAQQEAQQKQLQNDMQQQNHMQQQFNSTAVKTQQAVEQMRSSMTSYTAPNGNVETLSKAAIDYTDLVESYINEKTSNELRCISLVTGAEPTEPEKNGTVKNDSCAERFK